MSVPGNQWYTTLPCNAISHWLGAYTKWSLFIISKLNTDTTMQRSIDLTCQFYLFQSRLRSSYESGHRLLMGWLGVSERLLFHWISYATDVRYFISCWSHTIYDTYFTPKFCVLPPYVSALCSLNCLHNFMCHILLWILSACFYSHFVCMYICRFLWASTIYCIICTVLCL